MKRSHLVFLAAALAAPPSLLHAQTTPLTEISSVLSSFRPSIDLAGDFNGDGVSDLLVGALLESTPQVGLVHIVSPVDGTILRTLSGPGGESGFGTTVANAGDLDGDGKPDQIVGDRQAPNPSQPTAEPGVVYVISGATGSELYRWTGDDPGDQLGYSVASAGDVDADGVLDVIVGAPLDDDGAVDGGLVRVYSGADGSVLHSFYGDRPSYRLGHAIAGVGDVNGDGHDDILATAMLAGISANDNEAYVYSGKDGSLLYQLSSPLQYDDFGWDATGLGDVNADGRPDFAVAALTLGARVRVYSGADGSILHRIFNGGYAVSGIGDYNQDGYADIVTADQDDSSMASTGGQVAIYSGLDKSLLAEFFGYAGSSTGTALVAGADANGDGKPDVYAYVRDMPGVGLQTGINVYLGGCEQFVSYCTAGVSASGCSAILSAVGLPSASESAGFTVTATGVEGGKDGLFFFGSNGRQANPWAASSSFQCVTPPTLRSGIQMGNGAQGTCEGSLSADLNALWASKPQQNPGPGAVTQIQLWYRDPLGVGSTTSLSDALEVTVCP